MSISMYQVSVPRFVHMLRNLAAILDKAQAYAEAKKLDPAVLPGARLFPDMLPLTAQVRIACDTANGLASRLSGVAAPTFGEDRTIADMKARVEASIDEIEMLLFVPEPSEPEIVAAVTAANAAARPSLACVRRFFE